MLCCRKVPLLTCTIYIDRQISFLVLYYLYRQLLRQEVVKDFHQAGRKVTVIPCTIHIDRKKVLLALYYSHRQQLRELALKKTYIKYAKSHLNTLYYSHRQEEIGAVLFT